MFKTKVRHSKVFHVIQWILRTNLLAQNCFTSQIASFKNIVAIHTGLFWTKDRCFQQPCFELSRFFFSSLRFKSVLSMNWALHIKKHVHSSRKSSSMSAQWPLRDSYISREHHPSECNQRVCFVFWALASHNIYRQNIGSTPPTFGKDFSKRCSQVSAAQLSTEPIDIRKAIIQVAYYCTTTAYKIAQVKAAGKLALNPYR